MEGGEVAVLDHATMSLGNSVACSKNLLDMNNSQYWIGCSQKGVAAKDQCTLHYLPTTPFSFLHCMQWPYKLYHYQCMPAVKTVYTIGHFSISASLPLEAWAAHHSASLDPQPTSYSLVILGALVLQGKEDLWSSNLLLRHRLVHLFSLFLAGFCILMHALI